MGPYIDVIAEGTMGYCILREIDGVNAERGGNQSDFVEKGPQNWRKFKIVPSLFFKCLIQESCSLLHCRTVALIEKPLNRAKPSSRAQDTMAFCEQTRPLLFEKKAICQADIDIVNALIAKWQPLSGIVNLKRDVFQMLGRGPHHRITHRAFFDIQSNDAHILIFERDIECPTAGAAANIKDRFITIWVKNIGKELHHLHIHTVLLDEASNVRFVSELRTIQIINLIGFHAKPLQIENERASAMPGESTILPMLRHSCRALCGKQNNKVSISWRRKSVEYFTTESGDIAKKTQRACSLCQPQTFR